MMENLRKNRRCHVMFWLLLLTIIILLILFYAYQNMHYDRKITQLIKKANMSEKQVVLPDGSVLNYGENSSKKTPLLLLHGQIVSWEDYAKVLPLLTKEYHIYAVDYYGHGGSSKDPDKYSAHAIGKDLIWFIENVIKEPVIVSGHSSGGLLTAWLAANSPDNIRGIVIEDAPFFSTEANRAEHTYAGKGFKNSYNFLQKETENNYTKYSLEHDYMQTFFNRNGKDNWAKIVKNPALSYMKKHPGQVPRIWYYPSKLGVNRIYDLTANLQDGTGEYDLRFGASFYDYSWFDNFDQTETLVNITVPTILLHVAPSNETAPSYYDSHGTLLSAMDEKDAARVIDLVEGAELIEGFQSAHDIHQDQPKQFAKILIDFKEKIKS